MAAEPITPKPGFDWSAVAWGRPDDPVSENCSYCGDAIPDDAVPLRLWNAAGWAAVFCDDCQAAWWEWGGGVEYVVEEIDEPDLSRRGFGIGDGQP